ncbi:reverse transcriptase domain-containing protein [Methanosarcina acetivorans]|uniref:reverse transcriptase domain-containing protein n=2 Tax=Methanosarcina acetivorans TaxID=2214 RepID=UPI00373AE343
MYDRAMQCLYSLALEPIAEATSDSRSFGFRKFRDTKDSCEQIFRCLCLKSSAQWILEGDIKGCFDHINHQWLLDNIPMDKSILTQFLKADFVYKRHLNPTKAGTPRGCQRRLRIPHFRRIKIPQFSILEKSSRIVNHAEKGGFILDSRFKFTKLEH